MIMTIYSSKPSNPKDGDEFYDKQSGQFYIYHYNKWWLFATTKNTLDIIFERKQKINKLLSKISNIN